MLRRRSEQPYLKVLILKMDSSRMLGRSVLHQPLTGSKPASVGLQHFQNPENKKQVEKGIYPKVLYNFNKSKLLAKIKFNYFDNLMYLWKTKSFLSSQVLIEYRV